MVLFITFLIFFAICGVICVGLAHTSLYDREDIIITHLNIFIKSDVSNFPIVVIFFRGGVSDVVVSSYAVVGFIYIPGKLGFVSFMNAQFCDVRK